MTERGTRLRVVVLDYGAGNLRSVVRAVEYVAPQVASRDGSSMPAIDVQVSDDSRALAQADACILPGVGAAEDTMTNLDARGLSEPVKDFIAAGRPFLGVCMGQQALMTVAYEGGEHACLDVIPGRVVKLPSEGRKIPHMGWNAVRQLRPSPIFEDIPDGSCFYFLHSYYCVPDDEGVVLATADYGATVAAVIQRDNIIATQFHPEKSGAHGLRFYRNFLNSAVHSPAIA